MPMTTAALGDDPFGDHLEGLEDEAPRGPSKLELLARHTAAIQQTRRQAEVKRKRQQAAAALAQQASGPDVSSESEDEGLGLDTAQVILESCQEEAEPTCYDTSVWGQAPEGEQQSINLGFLIQASLVVEEQQCPEAWQLLLAQRYVTAVCGTSASVLQALFWTACSPWTPALESHAACVELCSYLQTAIRTESCVQAAAAVAAGSQPWAPSLLDLWGCLLRLGYQPDGTGGSNVSVGGGSGGLQGASSGGLQGAGSGGLQRAGSGGLQRASSGGAQGDQPQSNVAPPSTGSLKHLLQILAQACQLEAAGARVWDFQQHKDEAQSLLLALHRVRLHPQLMSALLPELTEARELLAEAWATADASSWSAVQPPLARQLAVVGPTHRAALHALRGRVSSRPQALQLSQVAAAALLERLLSSSQAAAAASGVSSSAGASASAAGHVQTLKNLLGQAQQVPQLVASVQKPDGHPDYWKLSSVIQAAEALLWPVQVAGELSEEDWAWWSALLRALDDKLGKSRDAAGVRRILSTIRNNFEFMRPQ